MTLYLLIFHQDTDSGCGSEASPFLDLETAQNTMRSVYEKTLELWGFDKSCQTEEHECYCRDDQAVIRDDPNFVTWTIETHQLDVEIAVEVEGGLVRNIYANADVSPDVYDLDVSAYPDEGEQEAADAKANELKTRVNQHGWRSVW
ncbi:MAG: hypothetical protein ACI3W5_16745 [Faecousia sp.]